METRTIRLGLSTLLTLMGAFTLGLPLAEAQVYKKTFYEHERPPINSTEGTTIPGMKTSEMGMSKNTDPVVGESNDGLIYDKRNGRPLSKEEAARAREIAKLYGGLRDVTVNEWNIKPVQAAVFGDGRYDLIGGEEGDDYRLSIDGLRIDANGGYRQGSRSMKSSGNARATLIGVSAEMKHDFLGDPDGLNHLGAGASGEGYLGADLNSHSFGGFSTRGLLLTGGVDAFLGGKAAGQVNVGGTLCGIATDLNVNGEASYGVGANASGIFRVNWSDMSMKLGGKRALTWGVGAGAGAEVEISLKKLVEDPRAAAICFRDGLGKAKDAIVAQHEFAYEKLVAAGRAIWSVLKPVGTKFGESVVALAEANHRNPNTLAEAAQQFGNNAGRYASTAFGGRDTPTQVRTSEDRPVRMIVPGADSVSVHGQGIQTDGGASSWVRP